MPRSIIILIFVLSAAGAGAQVDFQKSVRPILADRCFSCHGPDESKRKADLRLDTPDGAQSVTAGGRGTSALAERISSDDPSEMMPPPQLKRPLTSAERATLLQWIDEGAPYPRHWAFTAPRRSAIPPVKDGAWIKDPLDAFILSELERNDLAPEMGAEPAVLLRRASMVLTGLPPSIEAVDRFLADPSDAAYRAAVKEMLASKSYAEHAATIWLDLARYADTYGYQTDGECFTWPWRDWLLRSLDDNMPYDRFVTAIVAGDLLPEASVADRVATGFHRLHRMTEEGGSIGEEFRQEGIADRVATFGTTFLGLTLECARCHDHKYDPIPTTDFYGLAAMFGRIDENGLKPYSLSHVAPPFVRLTTTDDKKAIADLSAAVERAQAAYRSALDAAAAVRFEAGVSREVILPSPIAHYPFDDLENGTTKNVVPEKKPATTDRRRPEQLGAVGSCDGKIGRAMLFDGDGGVLLDGVESPGRHDPIGFSMWIKLGEKNSRAAIIHASGFYTQDADASGIELEIDEGRVRFSAIHMWPGSAASVRTKSALEIGRWTHLVATYDGSSRAAGLAIHLDGRPAEIDVVRDHLDGPLARHGLEVGSRSRGQGLRGGAIDELRVFSSFLTDRQVALIARKDGAIDDVVVDESTARRHFIDAVDPEVAAARSALRSAEKRLADRKDAVPAFMCMADSEFAAPTYVLSRGAYDQPDRARPVGPGAIDAVLPFEKSLPRSRMGLARWLVDSRNPLTARVEVNRLWAMVFGRGIVETLENFGVQGASPSHAALLDFLAEDFSHGDGSEGSAWNVKRMLERFVTSSTFRQRSSTSPKKREADPTNALLSRGPAVRISAEMLRDQALFASGLLVEKFGGPSVKPPQPDGLWAEGGQNGQYQADQDEGAHRRSVYTFRKRTVPVPTMAVFDAGSREACSARRGRTTTPLQSLVLWNDPTFLECARASAERLNGVTESGRDRIARAFREIATRPPSDEESAALAELFEKEAARFRTDLDAAVKVCGRADAESAALTLTVLTIFASDGALMIR